MSLLDNNKKGLTMMSALFLLFACEEPSELPLGISPKQGTISTHYVEIPVEVAQIRADNNLLSSVAYSPISPLFPDSTYISHTYFGKMNDPKFGDLKATAYTNIGIPTASPLPSLSGDVEADSAVLSLAFTPPLLGRNLEAQQTIKIYNLPEPIQSTSSASSSEKQYLYYTNDQRELNEEYLLGEFTFDSTNITDNVIRIRLNNSFANKIMEELKQDTSTFHTQQVFDEFIGSLAFAPGENNTFIISADFIRRTQISFISKIDLYYSTTASSNTNVLTFPFYPPIRDAVYPQLPIYYSLETDYSGTALEGIKESQANIPFQTSDNQLYFRAGVGLIPKFSFPALEEFVDSNNLSNVIINSAVLDIDSIGRNPDNGLTLPPQFSFYMVEDKNNKRIPGVNSGTYVGSQMMAQLYVTSNDDSLYRYRGDFAQQIEDYINLYNSDQAASRNYLQGMFFNGLWTTRNQSPQPWSLPNNLYSIVADPERIVLKIYYTTLEETEQDN